MNKIPRFFVENALKKSQKRNCDNSHIKKKQIIKCIFREIELIKTDTHTHTLIDSTCFYVDKLYNKKKEDF